MQDQATVNRFLQQATLGADAQLQSAVAKQGIEPWLRQQFGERLQSQHTYEQACDDIWQDFRRRLKRAHGEWAINGDGNDPALPYKWYFHMAWWQQTLGSDKHLLRQRTAQALSEILVVSDNSSLELDAIGMASYYDLLFKHAFGSYADLLYDVAMHPVMGVYLSHMNNRKADKARHIHPDENFAREIMQLFSIGLYELNADGSLRLDAQGQSIPTYDNDDIKQLARVFTGLKAESYQYEWNTSFWQSSYNGYKVGFNDGVDKTYKTVPFVNMTQPMQVDEAYHDRGPKRLLNGHIQLPGGERGAREIRKVVDRLVAHPSTAPFIAKKLIQQLVTSNPAPDYVQSVAQKFGSKGDLQATIYEILTYPQRHAVGDISTAGDLKSQKLKSPILRATQLLRAFNVHNRSGKLWLTGDDIEEMLQQHPLSSPTVFNFYKPDYVPHGYLAEDGLVAPEFELHTSANAINYVNLVYYWMFGGYLPGVSTEISSAAGQINVPELRQEQMRQHTRDQLRFDFGRYIAKAKDISHHDELIDDMSMLLAAQRNLPIKGAIKRAFNNYRDQPEWVVQTIAFMLAISPEFTVQEA